MIDYVIEGTVKCKTYSRLSIHICVYVCVNKCTNKFCFSIGEFLEIN